MARKIEIVTVPSWGGRDVGKTYRIEETDAVKAEKWFWRLVIAVKGTSVQVPEELAPYGMVVIAIRGINSFMAADVDFAKLEPLLDELLACVTIVRDPKVLDPVHSLPMGVPIISGDDIEDVKTVLWLRSEVVRIHTNFSLADSALKWVVTMTNLSRDSETT